jgi:hypothetical protein
MSEQQLRLWLNLASIVLIAALVCDFAWVISTALHVE